jgi:hypothetical protein
MISSSKRVLEPIERVSEVLFGLIMVLTFTGSLSVADRPSRDEGDARRCSRVQPGLGVIDAILYLLGSWRRRGALGALRRLRAATDPRRARGSSPPLAAVDRVHPVPAQLEEMRQRADRRCRPPQRPSLQADDWRGALGVFLLVVASMLPVVVPFLFVHDAHRALRVSNGVAVALLFVCGYVTGRLTAYHPWGTGVGMVALGSLLVAMTMALGGWRPSQFG